QIRENKPDTPIIMLTALGTTDDKVEGFDAGADDYLVKPFEMRELLVRIRALLKRNNKGMNNTGFILKYADLEMNLHTKSVKRSGQEISLTPKEFKLLEYMLQNPERVLSRVEIAEKDIYRNNRKILNEVEVTIYDSTFTLLYHDAVDIDFVKETSSMIDEIYHKNEVKFYQEDWQ
ncbi:response regulator MprA domain protein, partial [Ancylostoma ceylanicum]